MVVEKIIGNRKDMELSDREIDIVPMEWYEMDRKLLRKDSMKGEELGSVELIALHDVPKSGFGDFLGFVIKKFLF